jgi:predicted SprT family Zn-dependent metalloprotease
MTIHEAQTLALKLIQLHGLAAKGWTFKFDNARNRAGVCMHGRRVIGLSKYLLPHMKEAKVKDTILHEIAHALVGHKHGHDWTWQRKAIEIGCDGARCYDPKESFNAGAVDVLTTQSKYVLTCPECGKKTPAHRRPKRDRACGNCCRKYSFGRYDAKYQLILTQNY